MPSVAVKTLDVISY